MNKMRSRYAFALNKAPLLLLLTAGLPIQAVEFNWSGFLTLAGGKVLSGSVQGRNEIGADCPCMITDFSQAGVLNDDWDLRPDSRLGLQGTAQFSDTVGVTAQLVSRGARDGKINLEWLYTSWQINEQNLLQVGRKRLPLFYYSEQQDVSYTYPWIHLPPQTYGWEAVNYNGVNWNHSFQAGDWSGFVNTFAGAESRSDNDYLKLYNGLDSETDTRWRNIAGTELVMSKDWFEGRLMLMRSDNQSRLVSAGEDWSARASQTLFGASMMTDYADWIVSAELFFSDRSESYGRDLAYTFTVGRRLDSVTVYLTHGLYQQKIAANNPDELSTEEDQEKHRLTSLVGRYELTGASALKVQFDHWRDGGGNWFKQTYGDANALSFAYERVF